MESELSVGVSLAYRATPAADSLQSRLLPVAGDVLDQHLHKVRYTGVKRGSTANLAPTASNRQSWPSA